MYEPPLAVAAYRPPEVETLRYGNGLVIAVALGELPNLPVTPPEPVAFASAQVPLAPFMAPLVAL